LRENANNAVTSRCLLLFSKQKSIKYNYLYHSKPTKEVAG